MDARYARHEVRVDCPAGPPLLPPPPPPPPPPPRLLAFDGGGGALSEGGAPLASAARRDTVLGGGSGGGGAARPDAGWSLCAARGLEVRPEPLVTPRLHQTAALRRGGAAGEDGRGAAEGAVAGRSRGGEGGADGRGKGEEEGSAPQSLDLLDHIVVVRHMLTPAPATPKLLHDIMGARGNPLRARGPSGDPWSNANSVDYF
jgi:hypothetical protein